MTDFETFNCMGSHKLLELRHFCTKISIIAYLYSNAKSTEQWFALYIIHSHISNSINCLEAVQSLHQQWILTTLPNWKCAWLHCWMILNCPPCRIECMHKSWNNIFKKKKVCRHTKIIAIHTLFPSWCVYCDIKSVYDTPWSVSDTLYFLQCIF